MGVESGRLWDGETEDDGQSSGDDGDSNIPPPDLIGNVLGEEVGVIFETQIRRQTVPSTADLKGGETDSVGQESGKR